VRVLVAHSFYRVAGGEDGYVRAMVELLGPRHRVELLARRNTDLDGGLAAAARMAWSPASTAMVARELDRFGPDVVHLHNAYPSFGPAVHQAARSRGVPLVMTVHNLRLRCPNGLQFTGGAPCRRCEGGAYANAVRHGCFPTRRQSAAYAAGLWLHRFVARLEDAVAAFVAPSRFVRDRLLEWGIEPGRVELVRTFTVPPAGPATPQGEGGLYLGRLSAEKGLRELLAALRLAGDPPFELAGDGPLAGELRTQAARLGLRRARFLGRLDRAGVAAALERAGYLALPSVCPENAPLAGLEALAAGRPLLVARIGGLPELVAGGAGLACEPGDVDDLAAALRRLAGDAALRAAAGAAAKSFAAAELAPEAHRHGLERVYAAVTGRRTAPPGRPAASGRRSG
jgi:glycosyltransferase involved in cell wall biosynthesis